jgi:hypothetical protein
MESSDVRYGGASCSTGEGDGEVRVGRIVVHQSRQHARLGLHEPSYRVIEEFLAGTGTEAYSYKRQYFDADFSYSFKPFTAVACRVQPRKGPPLVPPVRPDNR